MKRGSSTFGRRLNDVRALLSITWPLLAAAVSLLLVAKASADVMAGVRAYVTGESHWSKGQKDAIFHLLQYARNHDERSFQQYREALSAPLGDKQGRLSLQREPADFAAARRGFLQGLLHEDDLDGVIFLFRWAGNSYLMAPSIALWTRGDDYISQLQEVGDALHASTQKSGAGAEVADEISRIEAINAELTPLTVAFSEELAAAAKRTQRLLLFVMLIAALIFVPAGLFFAGRFLLRSQRLALEKEALQQEVDIAARIQSALLPRLGGIAHLEVAAQMVPAAGVGGDCYDVQPARDGCWLAIGDVAGHGLSTGLVTMMTQSALSSAIRLSPDISPSSALTNINAVLNDNIRHRMSSDDYVTFVLLRSFSDGTVTYAGGHEELIVWRRSSGRCERVTTRGTWLGPLEDIARFTVDGHLKLEAGDLLVLYTDGVVEAFNDKREEFGLERLCSIIERHSSAPVEGVVSAIFAGVSDWMTAQNDDLTAMVVRYRGDTRQDGAGAG